MKTFALVFAALVIAAKAFAIPVVMVDTNGVLEHPTGFFSANRQALTNELEAAGYSPGGGAGSPYAALTNASQAFAPETTNTFHGRVDLKGDVYVGTSNLIAKIIALDAAIAGKADSDPDLTALAGLATTGILSRTGAGAYSTRAITGDSEIVVANGDGVAGAPTLSLGAGIARVAAVAASYQPIATILSRLSGIGLGTAGDVLIRDALGWTNLAKGDEGFVFTIVSGIPGWAAPGGGSGGNANTNVAQGWSAPQVFNAPVTFNDDVSVGDLTAAVVYAANLYVGLDPYSSGWGTSSNAPSKKDVYNKIESVLSTQSYSLVWSGIPSWNPADSTTYYLGLSPSFSTIYTNAAWQIPAAGTVKSFQFRFWVPSTGSGENVVVSLLKNGSTEFGLTTNTFSSGVVLYNPTGLSQAVSAGDTIAIKLVSPAWATNPTGINGAAAVFIQ